MSSNVREYYKGKNNRLADAFYMGQRAKAMGMMRTSPIYEDPAADEYWYGGYDGKKLEDIGFNGKEKDQQ